MLAGNSLVNIWGVISQSEGHQRVGIGYMEKMDGCGSEDLDWTPTNFSFMKIGPSQDSVRFSRPRAWTLTELLFDMLFYSHSVYVQRGRNICSSECGLSYTWSLEFVYALHLQCVVFTRYPSCACTVYPMLPLNWRQVDLFRLHYCIQNWFGFSSCWLTDVFMWCSKSQKVQGYSSKTEQ